MLIVFTRVSAYSVLVNRNGGSSPGLMGFAVKKVVECQGNGYIASFETVSPLTASSFTDKSFWQAVNSTATLERSNSAFPDKVITFGVFNC